ncbi:centrosomal protein of 41 kDa isoform X1 [Xiphophorus maculatus]|uniref:Centrosomal protein 41 n=1 Tax=Xiphophorus maculatus TaxID=8083 RepID=M3ZS39_XIPMA|nr:centrosomal protein of 41 kDa isoform X1 [Xiphophorus maculatus]
MSLTRGIGKNEYMKKRIPRNEKYAHVKTRLDTGSSKTKYMERLEEMRKNYRYRKGEIFKRLKVTTFAQLVLQVASVSDGDQSEVNDESINTQQDGLSVISEADLECESERVNGLSLELPLSQQHDAGDRRDGCHTARSTLLSVISGVGELNVEGANQKTAESVSSPSSADTPYLDCPYLLLDVRDRDQYDRCHIISAHSFPIAMLSRTMNPYTKEVLEYKNAVGKIIVVYDDDERIASLAATTMCERGFENLFMLCGGLKVIAQKFPSGMTTGSFPESYLSTSKPSKARKSSVARPSAQDAEKRWRFTLDELDKIQEQMEELIISNYSTSQLSSRTSSSSGRSTASSHQSSSTAERKTSRVQNSRPWK